MPQRRRSNYRRRPTNATKRVAKTAKYRKSAGAQAKDITTLARAVARNQRLLKDDQKVDLMFNFRLLNRPLCNADQRKTGASAPDFHDVVVIPLTNGPCTGANAEKATSNLATSGTEGGTTLHDCLWAAVQPHGAPTSAFEADGETLHTAPPWCKMYRQSVKFCLHSNNLRRQIRYTIMVVRLRRDKDNELDNTALQRLNEIDGDGEDDVDTSGSTTIVTPTARGSPNPYAGLFTSQESFYSVPGWIPAENEGSPTDGAVDTGGNLCCRMNPARYETVYSKQVVLGSQASAYQSDTHVSINFTPPAMGQPDSTLFYQGQFTINYGGAKVMPTNRDALGNTHITLDDLDYSHIDPKLKYWMVVFPSKTTHPTDYTGASDTLVDNNAVISIDSTISCKAPA